MRYLNLTLSMLIAAALTGGCGGGSIDAAGNYTAPTDHGTFHVVATSQADANQTATATVTVQAGSATGTIQ